MSRPDGNPYEHPTVESPTDADSSSESLTPAALFGVGVRLIAVYSLFVSVQYLVSLVSVRLAWSADGLETNLLGAFAHFSFGLILLSNASALTRFGYQQIGRDDQ